MDTFNTCFICDGDHEETYCQFYLSFTVPENGSRVDPSNLTGTIHQEATAEGSSNLGRETAGEDSDTSSEDEWDTEIRVYGASPPYSLGDRIGQRMTSPVAEHFLQQLNTSAQHEVTGECDAPPTYDEVFPSGPPFYVILRDMIQTMERRDICNIMPSCIHCQNCCTLNGVHLSN